MVWTINSHRALLIVVARNDVSVLVCFVKVNNRDQVIGFGWLKILSTTFYVVSTKDLRGRVGEHITHLHISDIVTFETGITDA